MPPGGWQQPVAQPMAWAGTPLSGWWSRVAAQLIDALILTIPVIVLTILVVAVATASEAGAIVTGVFAFLAYVVVAIFYAPVLMKRPGPHNGQSWGKQAMSIAVVRDSGEEIGLGYGFLREIVIKQLLFGFVGGFFFSIPTILNYLWPLWDDQNRALHDMLAKSHVVKR
ncbi:MAG TPA: RDD family protein [Thermoleophilaceae bacterium]|nr:RDD family protein [Thermoleophilaceae bacterium]